MTLATEAGPTDIPLLDETIGANLARTVAAHGSREALVARHQGVRWTYDELAERVAACAKGLMASASRSATASGCGARTTPSGRCCSTPRPSRRDPRQHQPGVPHPRAAVRRRPIGLPDAVRGAVVQDVRLRRDGRAGPPRAARAGALDLLLGRRLGRARGRRRSRRRDGDLAARAAGLRPGEPSTSSTRRGRPASPRAPRSATATSSTTATSWPACRASSPATGCASRCRFYHCFGMVMGNLGCTTHGATMVYPSDAFDPTHVLETIAGRAVHGALRRADDVHRRARPPRVRPVRPDSLRTGMMAGAPCPVEVMKACRRPHAHDRGDDLLRHDRDVAGVDPDAARRLAAPPHGHRRSGPSARRDPHRRPRDRRTIERGETGEFCTRGYSVMSGYWNDADAHGRGHRRRAGGCTPATWP